MWEASVYCYACCFDLGRVQGPHKQCSLLHGAIHVPVSTGQGATATAAQVHCLLVKSTSYAASDKVRNKVFKVHTISMFPCPGRQPVT